MFIIHFIKHLLIVHDSYRYSDSQSSELIGHSRT